MSNPYMKSVSDATLAKPSGDATAKLMNETARENPDNVSASNELKQFEGGKSKGKFGALGKQGKDF